MVAFFLTLPFMACFFLNGNLSSQSVLATLDGTITDEEGATLPGVAVVITNMETGYIQSTVSRSNGRYLITGIQAGKYSIEASLSGFVKQVRKGVVFSVGGGFTINFELTIATIDEEITVVEIAPMVEVTRADVSSVIDRELIDSLPMPYFDRNLQGWRSFAVLAPGVHGDQDMVSMGQAVAYGGMSIDGVSNDAQATGRPQSDLPDDAVQEFRVITGTFRADTGHSSGLRLSALTRSGTNDFSGRLSWNFQNEAFQDRNYFFTHDGYLGEKIPKDELPEKPKYTDHRYSFFLSGPIKKDKVHYFLSYQGQNMTNYRVITSPLVEQETVTYNRMKNMVFLKINFQPSEKHLLAFRYALDRPTILNAGPGGLNTRDMAYNMFSNTHTFVAEAISYPSGNSMNELRLHFTHHYLRDEVENPDAYTIRRPSGRFGKPAGRPQWSKQPRYQIVNHFNLFLNNHHIKVGLDYSYCPWYHHTGVNQPGTFVFRTDDPFDPRDRDTYPHQFSYTEGEPGWDMPYHQFAIYAQNSWKIHPRLNLDIGLRFQYYQMDYMNIDTWNIRHFNPRLGFAWDPVGDGKNVIRGGLGTYSAAPTLRGTNVIFAGVLRQFTILRPGYPDPFAPNPFYRTDTREQTEDIQDVADDLVHPYTFQTSLGYQREVFTGFSAGVDLVMARGYRLWRQAQLNPIIPGTRTERVNPELGNWWLRVDDGKSDYKALYLTLMKRYSQGWGLNVTYTLSKAMTDTMNEMERPAHYDDPENLRMWGPTNFDRRHQVTVLGRFGLPYGFHMTGIMRYRSPDPWTPMHRTDQNLDSLRDYVDEYRNSQRGFNSFQIDTRVSKILNVREAMRASLFLEVFNVTNRANFGRPHAVYPHDNFGHPTTAGAPRQIQMGVRLDF